MNFYHHIKEADQKSKYGMCVQCSHGCGDLRIMADIKLELKA